MAAGFRPPRSIALAAAAVGIVAIAASAAYGISMDTKPGHKAKLLGIAPAPLKPNAPAPASPLPPTAQAPPAKPPAAPKPPAAGAKPPAAPPASSSPSTSSPSTTSGGGGGGGTPAAGGGGGGGSSPSTHHSSSHSSTHSGKGSSPGSAGFPTGDTPSNGQIFENGGSTRADHANTVGRAFDDDPGTAWTSDNYPSGFGSKGGVGIYVDEGGYTTYTALGIVTKTPGMNVEIYSATQDSPSGSLSGWTKVASKRDISSRQKISLPTSGSTPRWYLIWITKLASGKKNASISEVALLQ